MRTVIAALGLLFLSSAPAFASDYECVWRAFPTETRAAFTRDSRSAEDIGTVMQSGVLTEALLLPRMQQCGVPEGDAVQLGQYLAARALVVVHKTRLMATYGWHEDQFRALMAPVSQADRTLIVGFTNGERAVSPADAVNRFRISAQAQGASDETALRAAAEYIYARIMVDHLAPGAAP